MTRRLSLRRRRGADAPDAEPTAPSPAEDATPAAETTTWTLGTPPGAAAAAPHAPDATAAHAPVVPEATTAHPPVAPDATAAHAPVAPDATAVHAPVAPDAAAPVVLPAPDPSAPAGLEARPLEPATPSFKDRGRLRRRLRYLRRVRELGFRDLGGLVFDLHRFGRDGQPLVAGKLEALTAVDAELRALERTLQDREEFVVLREPGIGACTRCAALHGSDANFCPNCGLRFSGPQAIAEVGDAPQPVPASSQGDGTWNWPTPADPAPAAAPAPPASEPATPATGSVRASEAGDQAVSPGPLVPEDGTTAPDRPAGSA